MKLTEEDALHQLDRVLGSKSLQGSEVHRRLLVYLAQKSLAGQGESLKEYTIALEALGKPSTYDPKHDSVVRIQIGRLRNKLVEYYHTEGAADPVVVSVPKGSFKVNFEPALPQPPPRAEDPKWRRLSLLLAALSAAALVWAVIVTVKLVRAGDPAVTADAWNSSLEEIWAPFLQSKRPLLVCVGTPLFANIPGRGFLRVPKSESWEELAASQPFSAIARTASGPPIPWYSYTGVGEAGASFLIARLLGSRHHDVLLTRSNVLSWQEVSDTNLIFLGPPKFNRQLHAIPAQQDITIEADGVRIANPKPGEPSYLADHFVPGAQFDGVTHAVISRTPGLSGNGETLTLAGNGTPDTLAAAQWVTQPSLAAELTRRIRLPNGLLPVHYQVVLRVEFRNGVPMKTSYVLHRSVTPK